MRSLLDWFIFFSLLLPGRFPVQVSSPNIVIRSPAGGDAVQGTVQVSGNANPVGFVRYELNFAYHADPTGTWFLIAEGREPVRGAALAEWNTFEITDGDYDLRLSVELDDGNIVEHIVRTTMASGSSNGRTSARREPVRADSSEMRSADAFSSAAPELGSNRLASSRAAASRLPSS